MKTLSFDVPPQIPDFALLPALRSVGVSDFRWL
jgi:hypothetical protein